MKRVTIFCGSSLGWDKIFEEQAYLLGKALANEGIGVVYGGAKVGLMGAVADGALAHGGEVIGVLPRFLMHKEIAHAHLNDLILVDTMHERKFKMNELSNGIIALPGGFGTLEELFEMLTWAQLGLHQKPIGLLNTAGFYDELFAFIDTMEGKGFLKPVHQNLFVKSADAEELLQKLKDHQVPQVKKWMSRDDL
ncbi:MAG: TIGR00730 family Rossman fold protein [Niabella sp.]